MANTPIEPTAPTEHAAVITPPDANLQSAVGNGDQWNELENQVLDTFKSRADQATQRAAANGASGAASDSTGAETKAAQSPADQGSAPVVSPPAETPADPPVISPPVSPISPIDAPPVPPVAAPAPTPAESGQLGSEPGTFPAQVVAPGTPAGPGGGGAVPAAPAAETPYDPFAVAPAPEPVALDAGATVPAPQSLPPGYVDFMGQQMPIQEAQTMRDTYNWARSLTAEESNAINAFIQQQRTQPAQPQPGSPPTVAPGYPPAPGTTYPNQPAVQSQPQPYGAPSLTPPPQIDPSTVDDPAIATFLNQQSQWFAQQSAQQQQIIQQQQAQLAAVQQQAQVATQHDAQQQAQQSYQQVDQARWDFALRHSLSPGELEAVESRLIQSNLLVPLVERKGGDVYAGTIDGLETVMWTDPQLRQRVIAQEVAPAVTDSREIQQRAAKVGALGGSGGSVPANNGPATPQDRHNAMVAEIRTAMESNPS